MKFEEPGNGINLLSHRKENSAESNMRDYIYISFKVILREPICMLKNSSRDNVKFEEYCKNKTIVRTRILVKTNPMKSVD